MPLAEIIASEILLHLAGVVPVRTAVQRGGRTGPIATTVFIKVDFRRPDIGLRPQQRNGRYAISPIDPHPNQVFAVSLGMSVCHADPAGNKYT